MAAAVPCCTLSTFCTIYRIFRHRAPDLGQSPRYATEYLPQRERERGLYADYHQAGLASVSAEEEEVDQITTPTIKTSKVTTAPPTRYMFLICPARYTHQYSLSWSRAARKKPQTYSTRLFGEPFHDSALSMPTLASPTVVFLPRVVTIVAMTCIAVAALVSAGGARPVARG